MKIVFTPDWFLNSDVFIEAFSFLILILFVYICYKNYKLSKNKNIFYLGTGFFLVALAEISTLLTKIVLYYSTPVTQTIGQIAVTYNVVNTVDIFYYAGFFLHRFFTLAGLYIIYRIPLKRDYFKDFGLALIFIIISAWFSQEIYYVFHITALFLLIMIVSNYYDIYKKNKLMTTKLLVTAFGLLGFSQVLFILSKMNVFYAVAQIIQVVSYIILLILILILQYGKKKKSNKNNI